MSLDAERHDRLVRAEARFKELEDALRFYADPANHVRRGWQADPELSPIQVDRGARARAALKLEMKE